MITVTGGRLPSRSGLTHRVTPHSPVPGHPLQIGDSGAPSARVPDLISENQGNRYASATLAGQIPPTAESSMTRTAPTSGRGRGNGAAGSASRLRLPSTRVSRTLMAGGLAAVTAASAFVTIGGIAQAGTPPTGPGNIEIFNKRSMVALEGYRDQAGQEATVEVLRGGDTIGIGRGTVDSTGFLEFNHPGGECWIGVTPTIKPGDEVRVSFSGESSPTPRSPPPPRSPRSRAADSRRPAWCSPGDPENRVRGTGTVTIRGTYDPDRQVVRPDAVQRRDGQPGERRRQDAGRRGPGPVRQPGHGHQPGAGRRTPQRRARSVGRLGHGERHHPRDRGHLHALHAGRLRPRARGRPRLRGVDGRRRAGPRPDPERVRGDPRPGYGRLPPEPGRPGADGSEDGPAVLGRELHRGERRLADAGPARRRPGGQRLPGGRDRWRPR